MPMVRSPSVLLPVDLLLILILLMARPLLQQLVYNTLLQAILLM